MHIEKQIEELEKAIFKRVSERRNNKIETVNDIITLLDLYDKYIRNEEFITEILTIMKSTGFISRKTQAKLYVELLTRNYQTILMNTVLKDHTRWFTFTKYLERLNILYTTDDLRRELNIPFVFNIIHELTLKNDIKRYIKLKQLLYNVDIIEKLNGQEYQ